MSKLVVLQGDERRDDDRRPVQQQAGELVDRGFAASRRQHGQNVATDLPTIRIRAGSGLWLEQALLLDYSVGHFRESQVALARG
jgi:hypothetical protein